MLTPDLLSFATDFADQAVILPLAATVAGVLALQRRWRVVFAWVAAVCGVLGTMLVLKLACYTCGWLWPMLGPEFVDLQSPSGHAASAAVVYGGIAALQPNGCRRQAAWVALIAAAVATLVIGVTRIELGAHSLSEVALAGVVGMAGALAFVVMAGAPAFVGRAAEPSRKTSGAFALIAAALVVMIMHGRHLPAEAVIQGRGVSIVRSVIQACQPDWAHLVEPPRPSRTDAGRLPESS